MQPGCAICTYFRAPNPPPAGKVVAEHMRPGGECWRFPSPVQRKSTDVCGEFREFHEIRFAEGAS